MALPAQDRQRLEECLQSAYVALQEFQTDDDLLPEYLRKPYRDGWAEAADRFGELGNKLGNLDPVTEEALRVAGLTGEHLELKATGTREAGRAYASGKSLPMWPPSLKRRAMMRLLKWLNIFLGSFASVIPAAELIKEYKEAAEQGLEEAEDA